MHRPFTNWVYVSPPLSWAFSRFRFFFCTHKYKPLLKQILWQKAQQIWNLETMWNLQSYYLQFPWSAHSCLWRTSPGTSATRESHQHRSEISVKDQLKSGKKIVFRRKLAQRELFWRFHSFYWSNIVKQEKIIKRIFLKFKRLKRIVLKKMLYTLNWYFIFFSKVNYLTCMCSCRSFLACNRKQIRISAPVFVFLIDFHSKIW